MPEDPLDDVRRRRTLGFHGVGTACGLERQPLALGMVELRRLPTRVIHAA